MHLIIGLKGSIRSLLAQSLLNSLREQKKEGCIKDMALTVSPSDIPLLIFMFDCAMSFKKVFKAPGSLSGSLRCFAVLCSD